MIGLGIQEIVLLAFCCGLPAVVAVVTLVVIMARKPPGAQRPDPGYRPDDE